MISLFFQLVIDGLSSGAIYAALALSLVLIHRATRVVNFGQGAMATFSAFLFWQLMQWGVPAYVALPAIGVTAFCIGMLVFQLAIRPVQNAPVETVVVVTLGVLILFEGVSLWFWGSEQREIFKLFPEGAWNLAGVRVTFFNAGVLGSVCTMAIVLAVLFKFTKIGLGMRAAAAERLKSPLVGIRVERTLLIGWGLASTIGFLAAILIAPKVFLSQSMMVPVLIYSLAAATIGGWDSPLGAIVSGLLVGVAESLGSVYISWIGAELRIAMPVILLFFILLVKPAGLFGKSSMVRA